MKKGECFGAYQDFFRGLISLLICYRAAFITIIFHEVSHGYAAYLLGDRTARDRGRLSLNPLRHVDVLGLLMMIFFRSAGRNPYLWIWGVSKDRDWGWL